ncbi:hypothetical protein IQ209_04095 [Xenorhabdus sp. BG5]|nr:hypothetical protein [Xenorhabdus sp. BG5]MBE8595721.1 hypothetical protein [Xenorhabdus sp. BG5]
MKKASKIAYWLVKIPSLKKIRGKRSIAEVKMNTFGWFDFKSARITPPEG